MSVMAYAPFGAGGIIIRVEADIRRGIPGIDITGLAEGAVKEARERVRAAFRNSGFMFPPDRVLINLAPAGMRKDGAALDLPIALSVMAAAGLAPVPGDVLVMGELELSGRIRPVRGVLAAIAAGLDEGIGDFIVPAGNAREAAILSGEGPGMRGARFAAASTLQEAVRALFVRQEEGALPAYEAPPLDDAMAGGGAACGGGLVGGAACGGGAAGGGPGVRGAGDFADVRGQTAYKRALEIAAAGGHNVLVFGPPGAGKTMLARRLPSIMAPLTADEAVEVTRLYSLAGPFKGGGGEARASHPASALSAALSSAPGGFDSDGFIDRLITHPPFRAPHHTASAEGILGGGRTPRPGEISLAHLGVLFLDEAPEFRANVLQALREPLEDRVISIVRAEGLIRLPAEFQLLLAANPCPCGRLGIREGADIYGDDGGGAYNGMAYNGTMSCFCSPEEIYRYWRKFGGALLDRIEIRVAVLPPKISEMGTARRSSGSRGSGDCDCGTCGGDCNSGGGTCGGGGDCSSGGHSGGDSGNNCGEERSEDIARRVQAAVEIQRQRFKGTGIRRNALLPAAAIDSLCPMSEQAEGAFRTALARLGLSGRAYHGILRVARTIADLEGREIIESEHILEAVQYRRLGDDPFEILNSEH